jgi:hypothetical protein
MAEPNDSPSEVDESSKIASSSEAEQSETKAPSPPVLALASTGRAGCKACGEKIQKGALRVGEKVFNPYVDAETLYWFHVHCAAHQRPEAYLAAREAALADGSVGDTALDPKLLAIAERGKEHYRLARITRLELAPSGRARCRSCRETIDKGAYRFALAIFQEGRFDPIGFVHLGCDLAYFGVRIEPARADHAARHFTSEELLALHEALAAPERQPEPTA